MVSFIWYVVQMVMSNLRGELTRPEMKMYEPSDAGTYERKRGTYDWNGSMDDPFWDESDMWLGVGMWIEGAWVPNYSSIIDPDDWKLLAPCKYESF